MTADSVNKKLVIFYTLFKKVVIIISLVLHVVTYKLLTLYVDWVKVRVMGKS